MKRAIFTIAIVFGVARSSVAAQPCARIVSLAPSVTEVIFDLGLGDRLVGVTRYCRYPPQAESISKIGGFYDVSLESLLTLKPTNVFGLRENQEIRLGAERFGVSTSEVDHTTVAGIKNSITIIAETCGVAELGREKIAALEARERAVRTRMDGASPYRTLVVVGRTREGSAVSGAYVSGRDGFYTGVLEILGMKNVNQDLTVAVPTLSPEGILTLAPEVIVEIVSADDKREVGDPTQLWRRYSTLPAVKENRIFVLSEDYASIPGPRYILVAEDLARKIRPQVK